MAETPQITRPKGARWWKTALPGLLLLPLVLLAYLPALRGEFIWDDDYNVIKSAPLRSLDGLRRIWFEPGATQQYYPLTHTTFWLDYHLWGLHPWGYHLENILLHAFSAILLWFALRRLKVPGSWLGAALFALHPVGVESVAWITERKNTLSGVFFLGSMLAVLKFWRLDQTAISDPGARKNLVRLGPGKFYWLALGLYACALWSKTSTVGLPVVILLLLWWKRRRFGLRDAVLVAPFFAVGIGMALMTVAVEKNLLLIGMNGEEWGFSWVERSLVAGRALWFYLGKQLWPHPLIFIYPRWTIQTSQPLAYAPIAAGIILLLILWRERRGWARSILFAIGYFCVMLFPVLGFFNGIFFRYSFVCDHFQYLASIGPLALAGAGITLTLDRMAKEKPLLKSTGCAALLLTLSVLTWRQTAVYRNLEMLWRDTLARNPEAWMAHDNLGLYLSQAGRFEEAREEFRAAIQIHANDYVAYYDLGLDAALRGNLGEAVQYYTKTLQICTNYALGHYDLGNALAGQGKLDEAIQHYNQALQTQPNHGLTHFNLGNALAREGKLEEAVSHYRKAAELEPDFVAPPFSLANALARLGKLDEAVQCYTRVLRLKPDYAPAHANLGRVLASQGKLDEAIAHYQQALLIDPKSVDALANLGNALLGKGRLDEAVQSYRAALRLNPNSPVIHYDLGVALTRQGKPVEAQEELAEARRLKSGQPGASGKPEPALRSRLDK